MELETEREGETREVSGSPVEDASGQATVTDGREDSPQAEGTPASEDVPPAEEVTWRALPALGDGLLRLCAAFGIGLLTGVAWNAAGRVPPSAFGAALGWAAALCAAPLLALALGMALDGALRPYIAHGRPVRLLIEVVIGMAFLILAIALEATSTDLSPLAAPSTLALALGLGLGFGLGGMRLRGMSGDARWLFAGLGVASLFGLTLPFIVPAALDPMQNGALGFFGCLLFAFGLPGVLVGVIGGGWQRMRVERGAFGLPPEEEDAYPLELPADHWSLRETAPAAAPHPLDVPVAQSQEEGGMVQPLTADAVIAELTGRRQALLEAIAGLSDEQVDRAGVVGEWSIKNLLAHLADQDDVLARVTPERLRTGEKPAEVIAMNADADAYNARTIAASAALSPQEQLAALAEARGRLVTTIRGLGDEALARRQPWPEWPDTLAEYFLIHVGDHEREHAEAIRAGAEALRAE